MREKLLYISIVFIFSIHNAFSQVSFSTYLVNFVKEKPKQSQTNDTLYTQLFLGKVSSVSGDSLLQFDSFLKWKLLENKIYNSPDAVNLIKILNPDLKETMSYPKDKEIKLPLYPSENFFRKRQQRRELRKDKKPNLDIKDQYELLSNNLKHISSTILLNPSQKDSLLNLVQSLDFFSNYITSVNRLTTGYVITLLKGFLEFCEKYQNATIDRMAANALFKDYFDNFYYFIPDKKKYLTRTIDEEIPVQAGKPFTPFMMSSTDNFINESPGELFADYDPSDQVVTFNVYVYDSRATNDPKKILTEKGLQGKYKIIYQIPMDRSVQECHKYASISHLNIPLAVYLIGAEKDHTILCYDRIDLLKYYDANYWAKYDRLAYVIDINPNKKNK